MGQPGPRSTYPQIIDKPEYKSPLRHLTEDSITAVLWAIWLYWLMPIATLLLWIFGIRIFYLTLFIGEGLPYLLEVLRRGGTAILVILTIQLVWVYYNQRLMLKKGSERRIKVLASQDQALARLFNLDPDILKTAKKARRLEVSLKGQELTIITTQDQGRQQ